VDQSFDHLDGVASVDGVLWSVRAADEWIGRPIS
jgi:hypothetical protein